MYVELYINVDIKNIDNSDFQLQNETKLNSRNKNF